MSENPPDSYEAGLRVRLSPDVLSAPRSYANHLHVTFTPHDFSFHWGAYAFPPLDAPPTEPVLDVEVQPVAQIVIPLNLVRPIIALLQRQVESYETNFGEIPDHPSPPAWMRGEGAAQEEETRGDS